MYVNMYIYICMDMFRMYIFGQVKPTPRRTRCGSPGSAEAHHSVGVSKKGVAPVCNLGPL